MEDPRKPVWKSGMLNDEYPTRLWYNQDGSVDFGMVAVPSKTGGKGTEFNDHFEGRVYEVIVTQDKENPKATNLECPCPGFEYRRHCRHVDLVRSELQKSQERRKAAQG